jgi:hypothetical protein
MSLYNIAPYLVGLFALFLAYLIIREFRIQYHDIAKVYRALEYDHIVLSRRSPTQKELDHLWVLATQTCREKNKKR